MLEAGIVGRSATLGSLLGTNGHGLGHSYFIVLMGHFICRRRPRTTPITLLVYLKDFRGYRGLIRPIVTAGLPAFIIVVLLHFISSPRRLELLFITNSFELN